MVPSILMINAPEKFRDEELLVPRQTFMEQGWSVTTASIQSGTAVGMLGAQEAITVTVDDVDPAQFQAVVVVGGFGAVTHLWENPRVHQICQQLDQAGKIVAAICVSPVVLAKAGLLSGRQATVYEMPESLAAFQQAGAHWTNEPVTVDDRIVTAQDPSAASAFARAVVEAVKSLT